MGRRCPGQRDGAEGGSGAEVQIGEASKEPLPAQPPWHRPNSTQISSLQLFIRILAVVPYSVHGFVKLLGSVSGYSVLIHDALHRKI